MSPQIEAVLRSTLAAEADSLGDLSDPWPEFAGRERKHKRNRRVRLAAVAGVVVAVLGVQSTLLPLPRWAPAIPVSGSVSSIADGPTRGSLAGDQAFLSGLRAHIKDVDDMDELWRITDRSKIKFVYAGDVGADRLALAVVPLRFGFVETQSLIWYEGAAGAAPEAMWEGARQGADADATMTVDASADKPGHVVVVGPPGSTVSISTGFKYTPEGRVVRDSPVVLTHGSGVGELQLTATAFQPAVTATVTKDGQTLFDGSGNTSYSGGTDAAEDAAIAAMVDQALPAGTFDPELLRAWVTGSLQSAQLPALGTTLKVRWTGTVNGRPAVLFTLSRKDSGVLAFAMHGNRDIARTDLRALFPAAGIDQRPIAWRMRAEGSDDHSNQLIVTAPPGAAKVELTAVGAPPQTIGGGVATLNPETAATVTAYRADGSKLGETPVLPFDNGGTLIGEGPGTRIVQ